METEYRIWMWTHFSPKQLSLLVHSPLRLASGSRTSPQWQGAAVASMRTQCVDRFICGSQWFCLLYLGLYWSLSHRTHGHTLRHTQACKHSHSQMIHQGNESHNLQKKWAMLPQAIPDQCAEKKPVWPRKDSLGDVQSSCLHSKNPWFRHEDKLHEGFQSLEE